MRLGEESLGIILPLRVARRDRALHGALLLRVFAYACSIGGLDLIMEVSRGVDEQMALGANY